MGLLRSHKRLLGKSEAFADRKPRTFIVPFGRHGHIYDVINGKHWGARDSIQLEVPVATPFLLAQLPYRLTGVTASVNPIGQTVKITVAVQVSKGAPARHVIRMRVTDANGNRRPEYDKSIVAPNGSGNETITLALNDPDGQWTIDLEDVATGVAHQSHVEMGLTTGHTQ